MTPLKAGKIPVISPIGWTSKDEPMNINGDFAACSVAASLKAEKIILLTDISGVKDLEGKKISTMNLKEAKRVFINCGFFVIFKITLVTMPRSPSDPTTILSRS